MSTSGFGRGLGEPANSGASTNSGASADSGTSTSATTGGNTRQRTSVESTSIHRLLDEAFAHVAVTAETLDTKEELRANLVDRAAELEARGMTSSQAAVAAFAELGDVSEFVGGSSTEADDRGDVTARPQAASTTARWVAESALNRVRPNPAFVVRTVMLSLVLAAGVALIVCAALGAAWMPVPLTIAATAVSTLAVGVIVTDSLLQTTTTHYPMPRARAVGYGVSAAAMLLGLALVALFVGELVGHPTAGAALPGVGLLVVGVLAVVVSIGSFTWLGVTQTNRTKPWAHGLMAEYTAASTDDRFSRDPAAAARFGIYTVIIWMLAFAGFVVLSIVVGFAWSWLALLAGLVIFFLVLARMLFVAQNQA